MLQPIVITTYQKHDISARLNYFLTLSVTQSCLKKHLNIDRYCILVQTISKFQRLLPKLVSLSFVFNLNSRLKKQIDAFKKKEKPKQILNFTFIFLLLIIIIGNQGLK